MIFELLLPICHYLVTLYDEWGTFNLILTKFILKLPFLFLEISLNNLQLCKMKYNLVSPNDIFYQKDFVLYHIKALLLMPLTNFCSMLSSVIRGTLYINWTSISAAIYFLLCSYSSYVCVVFFTFCGHSSVKKN